MGCGASTGRSPSVAALDAGELRDRSLQTSVELKGGVAQAGNRSHTPQDKQHGQGKSQLFGTAPSDATFAAARLPSAKSAAAAPPPPAVLSQAQVDIAVASIPQQQQGQQQQPRMADCAVSLKFLTEFCRTVPEDMPTWKVVTDVIVPATRDRRCRYVELVDPKDVGSCDYFVSHRWATPFSHLVRYVRKHLVELGDVREEGEEEDEAAAAAAAASGEEAAAGRRSADQVFMWCDIFAINQHPGQVQADDLSQLKDCVEASDQTLLCLDDKGLVLTRIWCLYEIWNTILAGGPQKLAVLGYDVNQEAFKEVYITLDVAEAQATVDSDRVRILEDIAASTGHQELNLVIKRALVESTQAEAENAQKVILPKAKEWKDYQRVIEAVSKHSQVLVALGRHQEAQRYGYIIQSVSEAWQRSQAQSAVTRQQAEAAPEAAAAGGAATAQGAGAPGEPTWYWSHYPRDPALRKVLDQVDAAEKGGRLDAAMKLIRDAVVKAQERCGKGPQASAATLALDLAGCQMRLALFLLARGFVDQAWADAAEPAAKAFEQHSGADSLTFSSAAYQVALLGKNNWPSKDLRVRLLEQAYGTQEAQLGPAHPATLATLREKAEITIMGGDMAGGVELFHRLAVRMSDGADLMAPPGRAASAVAASAATAAATAAASSSTRQLSTKAMEVWFLLANYLSNMAGREDDSVRICRALLPHKRRDHLRRLREAATTPSGEFAEQSVEELRRLGLVLQGGTAADADPPALSDPDDPRVDVISHTAELSTWSTALAKLGRMEEAVRLQWRQADVCRTSKQMADIETQLPSGKIKLTLAYERCLLLDLSVPGIAKVAASMLAERDGSGAAAAASRAASAKRTAAAAAPDPVAVAVAAAAPSYDGPGYSDLIMQMSKLWGELDHAGAEVVCRQIIRCQASGHGEVSKEVVDARIQLANLLKSASRKDEAVAEMRAALAVHEKILHGKDPSMRNTIASLADMLDDRVEGEHLHRRAVALVEKVHGPDHADVGVAMMSLAGFIMGDYERLEEGQATMERGKAIHQKFQERQAELAKAF